LLREGIEGRRIYLTGNPIFEVIQHYDENIVSSDVISRLGLETNNYFLVTMHRAENVDIEPRLRSLLKGIELLEREYSKPIVVSTHPRTRARLESLGLDPAVQSRILFQEPFGFFDFIALERNAFCVLSDSGTVQEECCIFKAANVTIRDVTERPETLECGSNILSGAEPADVLRCVRAVLDEQSNWTAPPEYLIENVSTTVVKLLLGYSHRPGDTSQPFGLK
jgi:UDP-N-acetylglucosamine 2-epimerase (non-hydrolysing)